MKLTIVYQIFNIIGGESVTLYAYLSCNTDMFLIGLHESAPTMTLDSYFQSIQFV